MDTGREIESTIQKLRSYTSKLFTQLWCSGDLITDWITFKGYELYIYLYFNEWRATFITGSQLTKRWLGWMADVHGIHSPVCG